MHGALLTVRDGLDALRSFKQARKLEAVNKEARRIESEQTGAEKAAAKA